MRENAMTGRSIWHSDAKRGDGCWESPWGSHRSSPWAVNRTEYVYSPRQSAKWLTEEWTVTHIFSRLQRLFPRYRETVSNPEVSFGTERRMRRILYRQRAENLSLNSGGNTDE